MGSSGRVFRIVPFRSPASPARVRKAVLSALGDAWLKGREALNVKRTLARNLIYLGDDSLLTVDADETSITFLFYETVRWPQGIAEHWLELALAARRTLFENALARLGARIDPADWPDLTAVYEQSTALFFETEKAIGQVVGGKVEWELKEQLENKAYDAPDTPLSALDPEERKAADQAIAARRCACGACKVLFSLPAREPKAAPGFRLERRAVIATSLVRLIEHVPAGWLLASGGYIDPTWVRRSKEWGPTWETELELSDPTRWIELLARRGDRLVAHFQTNSGGRFLSTSDDGGLTWAAKRPHPQLAKLRHGMLLPGVSPEEVWAIGRSSKELFHSADAGQAFELVVKGPTLDGAPIAIFDGVVVAGDALWAIVRTKKRAAARVARSADRGVTFETVELPTVDFSPAQILRLAGGGGLLCLGTVALQGRTEVVAIRSVDGGASWSAESICAGRLVPPAWMPQTLACAGPSGVLVSIQAQGGDEAELYFSRDGAKFERCCDGGGAVHADPTGQSLGFLLSASSLWSVSRAGSVRR